MRVTYPRLRLPARAIGVLRVVVPMLLSLAMVGGLIASGASAVQNGTSFWLSFLVWMARALPILAVAAVAVLLYTYAMDAMCGDLGKWSAEPGGPDRRHRPGTLRGRENDMPLTNNRDRLLTTGSCGARSSSFWERTRPDEP